MKILVGVQDAPAARAAIDMAARIAAERRGRLVLVGHLSNPGGEDHAKEFAEQKAALARRGDELAARLREEHRVGVDVRIMTGESKPSQSILRAAKEQGADLIVIGIRRRSRVGKALLGSNAQDIVREADVPVLSVKPEEEA